MPMAAACSSGRPAAGWAAGWPGYGAVPGGTGARAIAGVAEQRVAARGGLGADLVAAAGMQAHQQQRCVVPGGRRAGAARHGPHAGAGHRSGGIAARTPRTPVVAQAVLPQRAVRWRAQVAGNHRQVQFDYLSGTQRRRPGARRRQRERHHQRAAGDTVELVHRRRREAQRPAPRQRLCRQPRHHRVVLAMHRQPGGFVHHHEVGGAVQYRQWRRRRTDNRVTGAGTSRAGRPAAHRGRRARRQRAAGGRQGGLDADQVRLPSTGCRRDPRPVDADVALAQRLVKPRERQPR